MGNKKSVPPKGHSPSVKQDGKMFHDSTGAKGKATPYGCDKTHKKKYQ